MTVSFGYGTNGIQQVGSGYNIKTTEQAVLWSSTAASAVNLQALLPGGFNWFDSRAYTIDSAGNIFGIASTNSGTAYYAVEWSTNSPALPLNIAAGQTYHFAVNTSGGVNTVSALKVTINAGGKAIVDAAANHANRQMLYLDPSVTLAGSTDSWSGLLDINDNDVDLASASLDTVTNQIKQGYADGAWNGTGGIISGSAANDTGHLTTLGVMQNNQGGTPLYTVSNKFDKLAPGTSDILVKYTYYGDSNLDGKIDGSDYSRIDNAYVGQSGLTGWFNGDFNYDGVVNGSDYTLIDNAFNQQAGNLSTTAELALSTAEISPNDPVAVPEPTTLPLLMALALACQSRLVIRRIGAK